ncbi:MAG: glycine reductase [Firmicutes bacterium]|nr:glycine reductase [Bacillota bacterium]
MANQPVRHLVAETLKELADLMEGHFRKVSVCVTTIGSEHGPTEVLRGAELAEKRFPFVRVILVGPATSTRLPLVEADSEKEAHEKMVNLLVDGEVDAAVTMHYDFPMGTATVGRLIAPGTGREMLVATTTGMMASHRVAAMIKNAVAGLAVAKTLGITKPSVGLLNVDGAVQVQRALSDLKARGYEFEWATSCRQDGGPLMRGNDVLVGTPDVLVCDTLSGNLLVKLLSAMTTGGTYETTGFGYGPGVGEDFTSYIGIVSRASGASVIANAIGYVGQMVSGDLVSQVREEYTKANQCGLTGILGRFSTPETKNENIAPPPMKVPATREIRGIDVLAIEDAVREVWKSGIFASLGMGCTGPVIMVADGDEEVARSILKEKGYL